MTTHYSPATTLLSAIAQELGRSGRLDETAERFNWSESHHSAQEDDISAGLDSLESLLPSGSGLDNGCSIDRGGKPGAVRVSCDFHHMNGVGFYDGWTEHTVTARACLETGFTLAVSGKNRNDIKDYLADVFNSAFGVRVRKGFDSESRTAWYEKAPAA